jgi:hypothetical protein
MKKTLTIIILTTFVISIFSQESGYTDLKALLNESDLTNARNYINNVISQHPESENSEAWFIRGEIYYKLAEQSQDPKHLIQIASDSYSKAKKLGYEEKEIQDAGYNLNQLSSNYAAELFNQQQYESSMEYFFIP